MNTHKLGILIGRFQPLHLGHMHLIDAALSKSDSLLIVIGSADRARNAKNPFTFNERKTLIETTYPTARLHFTAAPDFFYSETAWIDTVKAAANKVANNLSNVEVTLFGYDKDDTTYYLKKFPNWHYQALTNFKNINATQIRQDYFLNDYVNLTATPETTQQFLQIFRDSTEHQRLVEEAKFVANYKASWSQSPYPPIFVTTDALVKCQAHILLIKRKFCPGKGLYALPGGFLEEGEWIQTGLLRELIEETQIEIEPATLVEQLQTIQVFDYPGRSLVGRVITHCGFFDLAGSLPKVHAADDALETTWVPVTELFNLRDQFHDDHYQIITTLLNRTWL